MVDVYDCALGLLRIGPFNYEPHAGVELLLQQTDDVILQCLSTTPEVEGPSWVKMVGANTKILSVMGTSFFFFSLGPLSLKTRIRNVIAL